jgi:signal transduction histidine kinase
MPTDFQADIAAVKAIDAVPTILDVICRITGMRFAAVARVTEDRWITCSALDLIDFGLKPGDELKVETTICNEIRQHRRLVVIDEVAKDPVYCGHHTPAAYGLQSYISMPIVLPDGSFFGTLCAIDPKPAKVNTPEVIGMFKVFAELIAFHLDAIQKLAHSEETLLQERRTAELREQFIAVLGHDLRNPLASIDAGARILLRTPLDDKAKGILAQMQKSVIRMAGLVDNVMDFARARLGSGINLNLRTDQLEPVLRQVIAELRAGYPGRQIEAQFDLPQSITADHVRLAQLFSNLVANALNHGDTEKPVQVYAGVKGGMFSLSVANAGEPIPPAAMAQLFKPFTRGAVRPTQQGLGLGLYIASEIARVHGGKIDVESSAEETRFTFRMAVG